MGIDAAWKRGYPEPVEMSSETVEKVTRRWLEYFPKGDVEGVEDPLGYTGFGLLKT